MTPQIGGQATLPLKRPAISVAHAAQMACGSHKAQQRGDRDLLLAGKSLQPPQIIGANRPTDLREFFHGAVFFVAHEHHFALALRQTGSHRRIAPLRRGMAKRPHLRIMTRQFVGNFIGRVGRTVVDDQQLKAVGQLGGQVENLFDRVGQSGLGVLNGQKHGQRAFQRSVPFSSGAEGV